MITLCHKWLLGNTVVSLWNWSQFQAQTESTISKVLGSADAGLKLSGATGKYSICLFRGKKEEKNQPEGEMN